jgi:preprotein translocase subunit Sec63
LASNIITAIHTTYKFFTPLSNAKKRERERERERERRERKKKKKKLIFTNKYLFRNVTFTQCLPFYSS